MSTHPPALILSLVAENLTSTFLTMRAAVPAMIRQGRGAIVTMSSSAGRQPTEAAAAYAATKAGVAMLSKHLAADMAPKGIRVNCLAPATVLNEKMARYVSQEQQDALARAFPLGRLGQPGDVADAAVFLLSDHASWLTGVTLDVSGAGSFCDANSHPIVERGQIHYQLAYMHSAWRTDHTSSRQKGSETLA